MRAILTSAAVLLLVASSALAADAPKPAAEMSALKYFGGSWTCTGDSPAGPFGPAHKTESTAVLKMDLDGFWLSGPVNEKKTASNTQPVKGTIHLGYDPKGKQYVMVWVDNFGSWATEMSPGWKGDTIDWAGEQVTMGEKSASRDTFTKKGDAEYIHKFDMNVNGQWTTIIEETCKKAAAPAKK